MIIVFLFGILSLAISVLGIYGVTRGEPMFIILLFCGLYFEYLSCQALNEKAK